MNAQSARTLPAAVSRSFLCAVACALPGLIPRAEAAGVKVIFDTDCQTDVDDIGALAVLHALADRSETEILATIISAKNEWSAPAVDVINTWYGRPAIPVAAVKGAGVNLSSPFAQSLSQNYPHTVASTSAAPGAVQLYRELLAGQEDGSVTIMTVGYATNLRDLLASGPDEHSPLTGAQLVAQKVDKWVNMGGNFEQRAWMNTTNVNWTRDTAAAVTAIQNWPTEIVFSGREIGHSMGAGARLSQVPADNPVRFAYQAYLGSLQDHHLADLSTVLYAVRGLEHGSDTYWGQESGRIQINADASFTWTPGPAGPRPESRLIDSITNPNIGLMTPSQVQEVIEDLMIAPRGGPDLTPPTAPSSISAAPDPAIAGRLTLSWNPGQETDAGSWLAGYRVYRGAQLVGTAYNTRFNDLVPLAGNYQYTVKAINASGIESAAATALFTVGSGGGDGDGLNAEYFDNVNFTALKGTRTDAAVNFDWGTGAPLAGMGADSFSVRWTGFIEAAHAAGLQEYTFFTSTNDGVRLWIDGQLLIDDWVNGPLREKQGKFSLLAGHRYPITLEYYENTNTAVASLSWQTDSLSRQIVPQQRLYTQVPEPASLALVGIGAAMLLGRRRRG